ncbi:hypothetical protein J7E96_35305 [Streptomyces sp. ISL-96]|uniref:hypothetical protein n=1 Tax=Streptomyces sp. ISL-96 TaxID=2819191 RepID=UPI001BE65C72|nr:hypothetical protein [Streptomyces sp. ISL-96]MBT2493679.1 hypothetical protein [Streptomyces sp. ISL-96]
MNAIDYAARFAGLSSDTLFALEEEHGDCDAPRDYVEQLLVVLTDWRAEIVAGRSSNAPAYERALNAVREAWLQYDFRYKGGPDLPYPFDLPAGVAR